MERTKTIMAYLAFMIVFFDLRYGEIVKKKSTKFISDIKNLSLASNIKKKLENNSVDEYNKKNKNFKISIFPNAKIQNEQIDKLKTKDNKLPYLYKSYVLLKNGNIRERQSNIMYIKKSTPYVSSKYISNKGRISNLGNTSYSFIHNESSQSIDTTVSNVYNTLMEKLEESYNKGNDIYIKLYSYKDMSCYFPNEEKKSYKDFVDKVIHPFSSLSRKAYSFMSYCKRTKIELREKMNELKDLEGNGEEADKFTNELKEFKSSIVSITEKTDTAIKAIERGNNAIYKDLDNCLREEYNKNGSYSILKSIYTHFLNDSYKYVGENTNKHSDALREYEDFLVKDNKLLKIKNKDFYKKKHKYALMLNIEEINDIIKRFKEYQEHLSKQWELLNSTKNNIDNIELKENSLLQTVFLPAYVYHVYSHSSRLFSALRLGFESKKGEIYRVFDSIVDELGTEIDSLTYPQEIESQCSQIVEKTKEAVSEMEDQISENCSALENLTYNYSTSEIFTIRTELTTSFAGVDTHNSSLKSMFQSINDTYNTINTEKEQIESLKKNLPRDKENKLNDITDQVLVARTNIEDIRKSADTRLRSMQESEQQLNRHKDEILGLIKDIKAKKVKMETLIREENQKKEEVILKITEKLDKIESMKYKLRPFIDLKGRGNEDLITSEEVIDAFSSENKMNHIQRKEEAKQNMEAALKSLFDDKKIEKAYEEIPNYVSTNKNVSYITFDLNQINEMLEKIIEKYNEIDAIITKGTATMNDHVTPAERNLKVLKESLIKESIEDLYKKMQVSYETFNRTLSSISLKMDDYKKKNAKLKSCEHDITQRKCEFLSNFIEDDKDAVEGQDTYQETLDLEQELIQKKSLITKEISNEKKVASTITEQLALYNKIEKYLDLLNNEQICKDLKQLKNTIQDTNVDNKIREHETIYESTAKSIDDAVKKVKLSKNIIEEVKIINKIINCSTKNNEEIEKLRKILKELDEKINRQSDSIKEDNLIEQEVKKKLLDNLIKEKEKVDVERKKIDDTEKKSKEFLEFYKNFKGVVGNSTEKDMATHSQQVSSDKGKLESITKEITELNVTITKSTAEVDNLIKAQIDEIVGLIHSLIIKLDQNIISKIKKDVDKLEETYKSFEEYNVEKDIKNINNENNKENIHILSQNFRDFKVEIDAQKKKYSSIEEGSKREVDAASDKIKENSAKHNDNRSQIKSIHENMKKILSECDTFEKELESIVVRINTKKKEYKKTLVIDYHEQIIDKKTKAETDIEAIDRYKEKIDKLKSNIPDTIDCVLEDYNYKNDVVNAKENQEKINTLEKEVNTLEQRISTITDVKEIHTIQTTVEQKLKEVIVKKTSIENSLKSITHMETMLVFTTFSTVMDDIKKNAQNAKEEEEKAEQKFIESERTKEEIWNNLQNAKKLEDLVINNFDEKSINKSLEDIREVHNNILPFIEKISRLLTEADRHKEHSILYYNNTKRGKEKITYLKSHDEGKDKKNITEEVEGEVNMLVSVSEKKSNMAAIYAERTKAIYELSLEYGKNMKNILDNSLIFGEKLKVSIKKNEAIHILVEIQDEYYDNIFLLEKLVARLIIVKDEDSHKKNEEDSNNDKSIEAYTKIEVTKTNANNTIQEIEEIKKKTLKIMNDAEVVLENFNTEYETYYEKSIDKLKLEKDTLRKAIDMFTEFTNKKSQFKIESNKIIEIKTRVHTLEVEMEINKKMYEEGILKEIKKIANQEKKIIEFLKESMKITIKTSIDFMKNSVLGVEVIMQKFEDPERTMNDKYISFDNAYKEIEKEALSILESSNTYKSMKAKREKAKIEKKKLEELNIEMNQLLNDMKYIKTRETLRLIVYMKNELDKVYKTAQEKHFEMKELTEGIKRNLQNVINATNVSIALDELEDAKNKFNTFKEGKIAHTSYKYNAYSIYVEINKDMDFIDMNKETIAALHGYEDIENVEDIILIIQGDSYDIVNKEKENEDNIVYMKELYEQVKVRDNMITSLKDKRDKINTLLQDLQNLLDTYKKVKEINVDANEYGKNVKKSKHYENFIKKSNYYEETYNNMKIDLKTEEITNKLKTYRKMLNDLDKLIEGVNIVEFTKNILEKAKEDINTIANKVNEENNNILGIYASISELLELRRNCKLYFLHLVITSINTKISKDLILFEKKKVNVIELMEYVISIYDSINKDIDTTNKCFSKHTKISSYDSNNIEHLNKLVEEFKRKERKVIERMKDIKKEFVESNKKKDSIYIDERLHKLKYIYNEYKKEKKEFKNIFKRMSEIELKERENSAENLLNISELYEHVIEKEKRKMLDNKKKLEEIKSFLKEKSKELLVMEDTDTKKEKAQKFKVFYEAIMNKVNIFKKLENKNNKAKTKLANHFPQLSYLIDRTKGLLKEAELYKHEIDYDLSKKENMEILYEEHNYIKSSEIKLEESKRILEQLRNCINQNKEFANESDIMIRSICYILSKVNNIKEHYQKEIDEEEEINSNNINNMEDTNVRINNITDYNFQFDVMKNELREQNKYYRLKVVLFIGILIGMVILCSGYMIIVLKKKNMKNEDINERCEEYENSKNLSDLDKKRAVEVSFSGQ